MFVAHLSDCRRSTGPLTAGNHDARPALVSAFAGTPMPGGSFDSFDPFDPS